MDNLASHIAKYLDSTRFGRFITSVGAGLAGWLTGVCGNVVANGIQAHGLLSSFHSKYTYITLVSLGCGAWLSQWLFAASKDEYAPHFLRAAKSIADDCEEKAKQGKITDVVKGAEAIARVRSIARGDRN